MRALETGRAHVRCSVLVLYERKPGGPRDKEAEHLVLAYSALKRKGATEQIVAMFAPGFRRETAAFTLGRLQAVVDSEISGELRDRGAKTDNIDLFAHRAYKAENCALLFGSRP